MQLDVPPPEGPREYLEDADLMVAHAYGRPDPEADVHLRPDVPPPVTSLGAPKPDETSPLA
jgi:hypothetical protein